MNTRSPWFLCLLIVLSAIPTRVSAQGAPDRATLEDKINQSHRLDPDKFGLRGLDAEQLFKKGLNKLHAREVLENYKNPNGKDPIKLDDLIRQNRASVEDFLKGLQFNDLPQGLRERLKDREEEIKQFIRTLKPEDLEKYAGAAQGLGSPAGQGSSESTPVDPSAQSSQARSSQGAEQKGAESTATDRSFSAGEPNQQANSALGRWLLKAADRFKELEPSLRNSPALQKAIRELSRKVDGADERWKELDKGANAIADKWARLSQVLPLERLLPAQGFSWPRTLTPRSLPNWPLPQTGPLQPTSTEAHPGWRETTHQDGWRAFWMLVLLAALALAVWRVLARSRPVDLLGGPDVWKLGPWPVQPAAVQTRDELIRAFEYLSVLQLGPAARSWHHWAIASGLGRFSGKAASTTHWGDGWERRRLAAEQLATLYERARYAPPEEPLPEAALATARQDLCLLAGVPVS